MKTLLEFIKRHSLFAGILLMFLLTWPIDLANSGLIPLDVPFLVYILLGWGFIIASLIMTGLALGKQAAIALAKRFLLWRVSWKWYLVALLLFPAITLAAVFLNAALSGTPIDFSTVFAFRIFGPGANLLLLALPFLLFDAVANGEEMGWRGYVLPRLQARHSALISSLVVGLIWGIWHLPKFLAPDNNASFALFMVDTVAKAVLYTWLYNNTGGSLLLVTLFHAASNTAGVFLPVANTVSGENLTTQIIVIVLDIAAAILVTVAAGPAHLSREKEKQVQEPALPSGSLQTVQRVTL
jgi:membrane protease YdiL (CAAX protease family)